MTSPAEDKRLFLLARLCFGIMAGCIMVRLTSLVCNTPPWVDPGYLLIWLMFTLLNCYIARVKMGNRFDELVLFVVWMGPLTLVAGGLVGIYQTFRTKK